jgi:TRAP-type mannitol/chloroaromatic compound transport system permease small subunit
MGFSLLALQCVSEALKRLSVLLGWMHATAVYQAEETGSN